jgi:hypothetical protein
MPEVFDSDTTNLMSNALQQALTRLRMLGLVNGDASAATPLLTRLILQAVRGGESDEENLVLYAIGRYQAGKPNENRGPG